MLNVSDGAAPLGKKQENVLAALLRGVPVLGHGTTVTPLAEADVRCLLRTFPACPSAEEAAAVNRLRPRVLDAVIGAEARRTGYVHGLPRHGVEPLLRAAGEAVRSPLVLRVVYGASTRVPLRALSYVLPAVRMADRLSGAGYRTCHVQVVLAGPLGGRLNGLAEEDVTAETRLLARCLDRLLSSLAPGRFSVYTTSVPAEVPAALAELVTALPPVRREQILGRLRGKGGVERAEQTLLYAAAHVLLHDRGAVPLALEHGVPAPGTPVLIDVGSLQERHFHAARRWFAPAGGAHRPAALVLTRHSVPPYTMARGGDIALRDHLDGRDHDEEALASAARHDLRYLWNETPPGTLGGLLGLSVGALR